MILVDTGAVIALLDKSEEHHEAIRSYLNQRLLLPITLLPEIDYLVTKRFGAHIIRIPINSLRNLSAQRA